MTHSSPTFAERLRAALGLDSGRDSGRDSGLDLRTATALPGPARTAAQRGQAFAERLRRALAQR